jgi:PhnB protein
MRLSTHLTFAGDCEAAFRFYERALGGRDLRLFRHSDAPSATQVSPEWRSKIVHASIMVGEMVLAGADVPRDQYQQPRGFYVLLSVDDPATAERLFQALSDNGSVHMPLQKTFWSPAFGVLVDRFGIPWEISTESPSP